MNIQPLPQHITSALDPNLVTTFENQTNWIVFTGTSCCGKTTMINQLAARGYLTVPEVARRYFDCEMAKGRKIEDIRNNLEVVERTIMEIQVQCESELNCDDIVFLDRALPDNLTFFRYADVDPNKYLGPCFRNRSTSSTHSPLKGTVSG